MNGDGGRDRLVGGKDSDILNGGDGNDHIQAAGDGAIDTIDCGEGYDRAIVDPTDVVVGGCEVVVTIHPARGLSQPRPGVRRVSNRIPAPRGPHPPSRCGPRQCPDGPLSYSTRRTVPCATSPRP
ncbi:MAG: hypothetical protein U0667_08820 [Chloroflexota bacterium]